MNARARRSAVIVASVPVETRRTFSAGGTRERISSTRSVSVSVGAPKLRPRPAASRTASTTSGCAWPSSAGPHEPTRSTYSLPSTSVTYGPRADARNRGVPPTLPYARTGELTPPGMTACARANAAALVVAFVVVTLIGSPLPANRPALSQST